MVDDASHVPSGHQRRRLLYRQCQLCLFMWWQLLSGTAYQLGVTLLSNGVSRAKSYKEAAFRRHFHVTFEAQPFRRPRPLCSSVSSFPTKLLFYNFVNLTHKTSFFPKKRFQKELSVHRVLLCLIFANRNQNLPKFVSHQVTLQFFKWKVMDWTFDRCWKIFKVFSKIFVTIDSRLCRVFSRQNSFLKNF